MISNFKYLGILLLVGSLCFGCLGTSETTRSTTGGTETGTTDSGESGSSTDSSEDGSSDSSSGSTGFVVSGSLATIQVAGLGVEKEASSGTVTDVMAVSPGTGNVACKSTEVGSDGTFSVDLNRGRPWFFYFYNRFARGRSMFLGRFRSATLDTLSPSSTSDKMDMETVTINADTEEATSSKSHAEIISSLGIDSDTADSIGEVDDLSRRYGNPDVDGDGLVDCGDSTRDFRLDFHVRYFMNQSGVQTTVTDLIDNFYNESLLETEYNGTGVYVSYPNSFSTLTSGSVTFTESAVTTSEGGVLPANTATSDVTSNAYFSYSGFGPNMVSTSELPLGEILFSVGDNLLTFSDVRTPSLAEITAPTGRIFPFIKFNKTDSECESECTLSGVSYKWRKKVVGGWTDATLEELDLLVAESGAGFGFRVDTDDNESEQIGFKISKASVEGTVDWEWDATNTGDVTLTGVTNEEFEALVTTQICHIGLSHDDKLGMRYFQNIQNADGTCE